MNFCFVLPPTFLPAAASAAAAAAAAAAENGCPHMHAWKSVVAALLLSPSHPYVTSAVTALASSEQAASRQQPATAASASQCSFGSSCLPFGGEFSRALQALLRRCHPPLPVWEPLEEDGWREVPLGATVVL